MPTYASSQDETLEHGDRILRYLRGSPGQGVWMGCNKNTEVVGYCVLFKQEIEWTEDQP